MHDFKWRAVYEDDTTLEQFNDDSTENKFLDIDRSRLVQFVLHENGVPKVVLHLDKDKRLIYRRRTAVSGMTNQAYEIIHIVGYQETVSGSNVQALHFVFSSDGRVETVDKFREGTQWFYPVNLLPVERGEGD